MRNLIDFSRSSDPHAESHWRDDDPPSARKKADDKTAKKYDAKDHMVIFGDAAFWPKWLVRLSVDGPQTPRDAMSFTSSL